MKIINIFLLLIYSISLVANAKPLASKVICKSIELEGTLFPFFSDNEKRLICGDTKTDDAVGHSWQDIPLSQAIYHIEVFLQNRGFFNSQFIREKESLKIILGKPTFIKSITSENLPPKINLKRKRNIIGEKLTPKILNELEKWIITDLQNQGYACPKVKTFANSKTGEIKVEVELLKQQKIVKIEDQNIGGIKSSALNRYNAFSSKEFFEVNDLAITARRIKDSGVLQGINISHRCDEEGVVVERTGVEGPPRLIRIGLGANTEGILLLRASWKNTRFSSNASTMEFNTFLSNQEQRLSANMELFGIGDSRNFWRPELSISREDERPYEVARVRSLFHFGTTADFKNNALKFRIGPSTEYISTLSGEGPKESFFLFLETDLTLRSHDQEFYSFSPRNGYLLNINASVSDQNYYSTVDLNRLNISGQYLYNFKNYDQPLFVLALRGGASTIYTDERPGENSNIPPNFLNYLGGSYNLRGFTRKSLDFQGQGAMTAAFAGAEIRWVDNFLPYNLQPFMFYDIGALGGKPGTLDSPYYYSPGLGLRWESPIGTIRGTGARGYTQGSQESNLQFYLSLGEEF
jgi:translocation and assembly module TamA